MNNNIWKKVSDGESYQGKFSIYKTEMQVLEHRRDKNVYTETRVSGGGGNININSHHGGSVSPVTSSSKTRVVLKDTLFIRLLDGTERVIKFPDTEFDARSGHKVSGYIMAAEAEDPIDAKYSHLFVNEDTKQSVYFENRILQLRSFKWRLKEILTKSFWFWGIVLASQILVFPRMTTFFQILVICGTFAGVVLARQKLKYEDENKKSIIGGFAGASLSIYALSTIVNAQVSIKYPQIYGFPKFFGYIFLDLFLLCIFLLVGNHILKRRHRLVVEQLSFEQI